MKPAQLTLVGTKRMRTLARAAAAALAVALASCGGSAGSPPLSPSPARGAAAMATVTFKLVIPTASSALRRVPRYVSASTQSASVTIAAGTGAPGPPTVINCTTTCTAQLQAPVGSDTFAVTLYDQQSAGGNKLCIGSLTQTIVANQVNTVNVALSGVVAGLQVVLNPSTVPPGPAATIGVTVNALDAGNNIIIGPGYAVDAFGNPVTVSLTDSDTSGATMLSQTSFQVPVSGITLSYNGTTIPNPTISASAPGLDIVHALLTIGNVPFLLVGNALIPGSTVTGYPAPITATSTPDLTISLLSDPTALIFDHNGNLYATGFEGNDVQIFNPPLTNASTSSATITTGVVGPVGLGIDGAGRLYVGNNNGYSVTIYTPPFTNASSPSITIPVTTVAVFAIAVDSTGNLYVGGGGESPGVGIYKPPLSNSSTPSITIPGPAPGALFVDTAGNLYWSNASGVSIYKPPLTSSSTPSVTIPTPAFPGQVTLDSSGNLYVAYPNPANEVAVFTPPFTNQSTPSVLITSGVHNPFSVAIVPPVP
jgi:hypothetical protein